MTGTISNAIVVYVTAPDEDVASKIATSLVESRHAACINIIRNIRSIYSWEGRIEDDSEVLLIIKTRESLFEKLSEKVKELHPYDVPEVIAMPIVSGSADYLGWLHDSTAG